MGLLIDRKGRLITFDVTEAKDATKSKKLALGVRSEGFIFVEEIARSLIVVLRPALVSDPAIASVYFLICRFNPHRVVISYGLDDRSWETYANMDTVINRIDDLVQRSRVPALRMGISAVRQPIELIHRIAEGKRLAALLDVWRETSAEWSSELYGKLRTAGLLSRAQIIRNPPAEDAFIIEHWGSKQLLYGRDWVKQARGHDIRDRPYPKLSEWGVSVLREARVEKRPRFDRANAVVFTPSGAAVRRHSHRLLLPFESKDGATVSVVVNVPRSEDEIDRPSLE